MRRVRGCPEKGDIGWLSMNPHRGREQAGRRPAMCLSPADYNRKVGLALFCPITSKVKGYPFEVELPEGLKVSGAILADQIKSLDWRARKATRLGKVSADIIGQARARILPLVEGA